MGGGGSGEAGDGETDARFPEPGASATGVVEQATLRSLTFPARSPDPLSPILSPSRLRRHPQHDVEVRGEFADRRVLDRGKVHGHGVAGLFAFDAAVDAVVRLDRCSGRLIVAKRGGWDVTVTSS